MAGEGLWGAASRKVLESLVVHNEITVINFEAIFSDLRANANGIFEMHNRNVDLPIKLEIGSGMGNVFY
jgi:tRNA G46 methylase TrmB